MAETEEKNGADVKSEATDLEKKIIRQLEYYFGDSNLRRDRFLQLQIREDDGWVPWDTMTKFNRLAQLSTDTEVLSDAIQKSTSGLIELSEDRTKIRRSPNQPLPEENAEYWQKLKERTVYAKGFNLDDRIDKLEEFFLQFGETEAIVLRRDKERNFKGSVFVTFKDKEVAKNFLNKESVKYGETELLRYSKVEYFKKKAEERKQLREEEKQKKKDDKVKKEDQQVEEETEYQEWQKGQVLYFTGASEQLSREDLKEFFGDYGTISWVEFDRGKTEGSVRFEDGDKAQDILDKSLSDHGGKIELRGKELICRVLEGEEEEEHWKSVFKNKTRMRIRKQQGRRGKGGKAKAKRQDVKFEGKRTKFEDDDDNETESAEVKEESSEPPTKQLKTE